MKDYDKNKESPYLKYLNVNNLYVWAVSQKLPVNKFEWVEYVFHIKILKQALNHVLVTKKSSNSD